MTTFSFWQSTANRPPKRPVPRGSRCSRLCEARPGCLMLPHRHLRRSLCAAAAGNDLVRLMQRLRVPYGSLGACTPHETAYQLCTTCSLLHECALFRFSIPVAPLPRATHACRVLQGASTDQTSVPHCAGRLRRHVHACRTPFICSLAPVNPQHPICRPTGSTERASATRHSSSFSKLSAATTAQRERSVFKLGGSDSRIDAKGMGAGSGGNGGDFRGEGDEGANASNSPAKGGVGEGASRKALLDPPVCEELQACSHAFVTPWHQKNVCLRPSTSYSCHAAAPDLCDCESGC